MFGGQPDLNASRSWIDVMEQVFQSLESAEDEEVLPVSYEL